MRIARPRKPNVPFKRKRRPPPQATKLLTYSMVAGIVFMVLLGIVFLPRMFVDQPRVAVVPPGGFRFDSSGNGTIRLYIETITDSLELAKFRANLTRNRTLIGSLPAGLGDGTSTLRFNDTNGGGLLDVGDYFQTVVPPSGQFRFEIFQVDVGRRIGLVEWTG